MHVPPMVRRAAQSLTFRAGTLVLLLIGVLSLADTLGPRSAGAASSPAIGPPPTSSKPLRRERQRLATLQDLELRDQPWGTGAALHSAISESADPLPDTDEGTRLPHLMFTRESTEP